MPISADPCLVACAPACRLARWRTWDWYRQDSTHLYAPALISSRTPLRLPSLHSDRYLRQVLRESSSEKVTTPSAYNVIALTRYRPSPTVLDKLCF